MLSTFYDAAVTQKDEIVTVGVADYYDEFIDEGVKLCKNKCNNSASDTDNNGNGEIFHGEYILNVKVEKGGVNAEKSPKSIHHNCG